MLHQTLLSFALRALPNCFQFEIVPRGGVMTHQQQYLLGVDLWGLWAPAFALRLFGIGTKQISALRHGLV